MVDWDGLNGLEGLVATGVWGTIEGVDACEGKWRVQGHDRLFSCTRETHARYNSMLVPKLNDERLDGRIRR